VGGKSRWGMKLQFSIRDFKFLTKILTAYATGAQKFDFSPKCSSNRGFIPKSCISVDDNFLTRRGFSDYFATAKNLGGGSCPCPPATPLVGGTRSCSFAADSCKLLRRNLDTQNVNFTAKFSQICF